MATTTPKTLLDAIGDDKQKTTTLFAARIAIGTALTVAPKLTTNAWLGRELAGKPGTQVMVRALGVRDAAIGVAGLMAHQRDKQDVSMWMLRLGALADLIDGVATWKSRKSLPVTARGMAAFATGSAAVHLVLSTHDRT